MSSSLLKQKKKNSVAQNSHQVMNHHKTKHNKEPEYLRSSIYNGKKSSDSTSDSSDSDCEEAEDNRTCLKTPVSEFVVTPCNKKKKKLKVVKKISEGNTSGGNETPSYIKRIHVSSDESDCSEKHVRKKARRDSETDNLPSFLRNLDITPKSDKKKGHKRYQESYVEEEERSLIEKKQSKKKKVKKVNFIDTDNQEPQSYSSLAEPIVKKPSSFRIPALSTEIVVLQHPTSVTLHKFIDVTVVSGGISVLGWHMTSVSPKATLFSYEKTGLIELTTLHSDPVWKMKETYQAIKESLGAYAQKEVIAKILEQCDNSSVILILQRATYTSSLKILSVYYPKESWLLPYCKNNRFFLKKESLQLPMKFTDDYIMVAEAIARAMRKATLNSVPGPRIVFFGNARAGKSTAIRFIINRILNMFLHVLYLDVDPGQPEFTPPGVVSLSKVDKCMLGPPFTHQRKPLKMVFTGSISAESSPPMYFKSVKQLTHYYFNEHSSETLFVNTMGWMKGIGLLCLKDVIAMVEPTIIVELLEDGVESSFGALSNVSGKVMHYTIPSVKKETLLPFYESKEKRNFSVLAYFGQCSSPYTRPISMNEMKSVCICWDQIAIYMFGNKIVPYRIVEAINSSFVALCTVDESLILKSDVPGFQTTLKTEPENICHGFGIVRAVDETHHLLHIITPLKLKELQKVNAIMKGNITIPDAVFLEQNITEMPLPFMDESTVAPPSARTNTRKVLLKENQAA